MKRNHDEAFAGESDQCDSCDTVELDGHLLVVSADAGNDAGADTGAATGADTGADVVDDEDEDDDHRLAYLPFFTPPIPGDPRFPTPCCRLDVGVEQCLAGTSVGAGTGLY